MSLDPIQQLVERQAIVDVIYAYCRNVDLVNEAAVADCFTEDCTVDYGPGMGAITRGKENIRERLGLGLHRFAATSHHVSNIEVVFDSDDSARDYLLICLASFSWRSTQRSFMGPVSRSNEQSAGSLVDR